MKRLSLFVCLVLVAAVAIGAQTRTLRLEIFDRGNVPAGYLENNNVTQYIQKAFGDPNNVKIEWVAVPRAKEVEKLNVMMAAGDAPDLCFTYDAVLVSKYAGQGGLADLTGLIKSNGANITKFIGKEAIDYGTFDGKIYAITGKRQVLGISGTWIRKDWLDTLKMPVPKTIADFEKALIAFRDKDPGNVGKDKVVPFGNAGGDINLQYAFYKPATERERAGWVGPTSTRPGRDMAIPGTKDYLKLMNKWNDQGLFPKDWALWPKNDVQNFQALLTNGYVGAFTNNLNYFWAYNLMATIEKNDPKAVWVPCDPFANSQGKTAKYIYSPIGIFNIVPAFSKNADLVVKYLNWMSDNKVLADIIYGTKDKHYDVNPDGIIMPRTLSGDDVWNKGNLMDTAIMLNGRPYDDYNTAIKAYVLPYLSDKYPIKIFQDHYTYVSKDGIPPVRLANAPDSLDKLGVTLMDKAEEMMKVLTISKPAEFDALYDAKLKEWLGLGGQKVKDDMMKQYDLEHAKK